MLKLKFYEFFGVSTVYFNNSAQQNNVKIIKSIY